jgi:glutamate 5-kinase
LPLEPKPPPRFSPISATLSTKLKAAMIAGDAGIDMVITNGENPENLYALLEGQSIGTRFIGRREEA